MCASIGEHPVQKRFGRLVRLRSLPFVGIQELLFDNFNRTPRSKQRNGVVYSEVNVARIQSDCFAESSDRLCKVSLRELRLGPRIDVLGPRVL